MLGAALLPVGAAWGGAAAMRRPHLGIEVLGGRGGAVLVHAGRDQLRRAVQVVAVAADQREGDLHAACRRQQGALLSGACARCTPAPAGDATGGTAERGVRMVHTGTGWDATGHFCPVRGPEMSAHAWGNGSSATQQSGAQGARALTVEGIVRVDRCGNADALLCSCKGMCISTCM